MTAVDVRPQTVRVQRPRPTGPGGTTGVGGGGGDGYGTTTTPRAGTGRPVPKRNRPVRASLQRFPPTETNGDR